MGERESSSVVLILSPHLDDAVLSCPTFIQRFPGRVIVCNIFSQGSKAAQKEYRARRREELRAAELLSIETLALDELDAPFRSEKFQTLSGILFSKTAEDRVVQARLVRQLRSLRESLGASQVFAPLAAGNHVDHRLTRDAALQAFEPADLRFYEDRPYSFVPEHIGHLRGKPIGRRTHSFWQRYAEVFYLKRSLTPNERNRLPQCWKEVEAFPGKLRCVCTVWPDERELRKSLAAISCYSSQLPKLFPSRADLKKRYREAPERYYRYQEM